MIVIPLRTGRGQNDREHFRVRAKRWEREHQEVAAGLSDLARPEIPCGVVLTRLGPSSGLDDDNLSGAMKAVRDAVAEWLGVDDKDERVRYAYGQERTKEWGVRIEFVPHCEGCASDGALFVSACRACEGRMLAVVDRIREAA